MTVLIASGSASGTELQIGAAAACPLESSGCKYGPNVSLEQELIAHQLQVELGISRFHASESIEWEVDLAFKKPFDLSPSVELTVGLGPTWSRTTGTAKHSDSFSAECSLDFQFWVGPRWGWYIEPAYEFVPGNSRDRSAQLSVGILIAF